MKKTLLMLGWACLVFGTTNVRANDQVGTLAQVQGDVKIFSHPGKTMTGPAPHALYEGETYSVAQAKAGSKVEQGNIVRTAPGSMTRVIYDNGDPLTVSGGSAYKVNWSNGEGAKAKPDLSLMYGKVRAMVAKGGPRSNLTVRTRSATMGVRGTDFFVADGGRGPNAGTEISVIRGEVAVKDHAAKESAKSVPVKAGYSAEIAAPVVPAATEQKTATEEKKSRDVKAPAEIAEPVIAVRSTTQQDLAGIQKASEVKAAISEEVKKDTVLAKKIEELEQKAVAATMTDIKKEDPKLFAQLQDKKVTSAVEIQAQAVETLKSTAPMAPATRTKPSRSEMEDLENGVYDQYFKAVN